MASLQAALKNAIQVEFQLEESELAAEPMPLFDERHLILFYEAAEGGGRCLAPTGRRQRGLWRGLQARPVAAALRPCIA
jgi:hypothetical protein